MIAEEENQQQTENKNQNKEFRMATEMIIRRMSDVQLKEVAWLWKPYIPFGRIRIIVSYSFDFVKNIVTKFRR